MAKAFSGKKPQHFGNTIRVFLNYLGRHKFMLGLVGVLTAVSALANLLGTYMIKPVVNGILETGSIPGLVRGVALTAAIYAVGALSTLGYTQTMVRAAQKVLHDIRRDGVEKWSRLAKSNCCSLRYSASRRAAAKPLAARAANLAYSRPVIRASTAQMIILLPCSIMTCISWLGTPWSTRSDISIGMTISKIHSTKTSPTARNKSRR